MTKALTRANLNGTDVDQRFITGCHFPETGLTIDSRYLYWANNGSSTIGRAAGRRAPINDSWIAATAIAHGVPIVTQDSDYDGMPGVEVIRI
jgi:predicted nucleic acid-binding protein